MLWIHKHPVQVYIWESTKKKKPKKFYVCLRVTQIWVIAFDRNLVWYIWVERVKTCIERVSERDRQTEEFCMRSCRILKICLWPFHKATLESIYLSIYSSIYYWLQKTQCHAPFNCNSPLPNSTDFGTKLLWRRHHIFVGIILQRCQDLAPVSRFWSKIAVWCALGTNRRGATRGDLLPVFSRLEFCFFFK
jgi:hypothetical protein